MCESTRHRIVTKNRHKFFSTSYNGKMRLFAGALFCSLALGASAQDYIPFPASFSAGFPNERLRWTSATADNAGAVIYVGQVQASLTDFTMTFLARKRAVTGQEIWTTRGQSALNLQVFDAGADGAGNLYVLVRDPNNATLTVKSLNGADGSPRWERTFSNIATVNTAGSDLEVKTVGNSTFVYVAFTEATGFIRLARLNPGSGADLFSVLVDGSLNARTSMNIEVDGTGNVYSLHGNPNGVIAKRNQGLNPVWARSTALPTRLALAIHPTTGDIGVSSMDPGQPHATLEVLNSVNGSLRRQNVNLPRAANGFESARIFGHPTGAWYYGAEDAFGVRSLTVLTPTLKIQSTKSISFNSPAIDSHGILHGNQFDRTLLANWPRQNTIDPGFDFRAYGTTIDSSDRIFIFGATGGTAVDMHFEQKFLAGTDTFAEPFTSQLNVEAPGVLANDLLSRGGTLEVSIAPTLGTVTLNQDGGFRYVPGASFAGSDQFQYRQTKNGVSRTATCFVKRLAIASVTFGRNPIVGGETAVVVSVNLSTAAFSVPILVSLANSHPSVLTTLGPTMEFKPGTVSREEASNTKPVAVTTLVTITASLAGQSRAATLTVLPGNFVGIKAVDSRPIYEGLTSKMRLSLEHPTPNARTFGLRYEAIVNAEVIASGPSEVTVPAGQSFVDFTVSIPDGTAGDDAAIFVTPEGPGFTTITFHEIEARPRLISSGPINPPIYSGFQHRFSVTLDKVAGNTPIPVTNASSISSVNVPTININPNQTSGSASFTAPLTVANQNITITSRLLTDTRTSTFLIRPNLLESFTVSPGIMPPFGSITARVSFNWVAPANGVTVQISTTTPDLVAIPSQVTMAAGRTTLTFPIAARGRAGNATVSVKVGLKSLKQGIRITN